ncbi:MAG: hypothetical protein HYZ42_11540, partial [Bacteroidetes bacterium]|nr:hypothetical protein [Bacteroidota bacterium]
NVNLGTRASEFIKPSDNSGKLYITVGWMKFVGYGLFILILILVLKVAKGILRDTSYLEEQGVVISFKASEPTNATNGVIYYKDLPISLARTQFLFWLLIIFYGIIHIWAFTDSLAEPTGSVLLLLGISGGTFYISKLIDQTGSKKTATPVTPPVTPPTPAETVQAFINNRDQSQGFIVDILNDGNGISSHRLQLVMFTTFLGFYFVWQVLYSLTMPQFSDTMLLLMGISSGTYAGLKTLES